MFNYDETELEKLGANITTQEIKQQPELWQEVVDSYVEKKNVIDEFIADIAEKHDEIRVIFNGAGTSAFVGQSIEEYLNKQHANSPFSFFSYATTDIVAKPEEYLVKDIPTVLVSFARSGNSPESIATVELAKKLIDNLYEVTITCAAEGKLAVAAEGNDNNLLFLQPPRSNDQGFAMTGSYTCMTLSALLIFDTLELDSKLEIASSLIEMGNNVLSRVDDIQKIVDLDFNRVVYLGSGTLHGVARESQLKVLELTAGKITTLYETPLGFRHGPKSYIDDKTIVNVFVSNDEYARKYDYDLLNEVYHDKIARKTVAIHVGNNNSDASSFGFDAKYSSIPDAYLALPFVNYGQIFSILSALKVENTPDTPSATGTVNRVVQGVIIHEY